LSKSSRWSEYRLKRRVQFHEVDSVGIVHFSHFFRYMEEAEHALWRAAGLSIAPPDSPIGWPRVAAAFDYQSPLRFEDEFDIVIRIAAIGARTIRYECVLARGETTVATGTLTIACVSRKAGEPMRATAIPADISDRFEVAAAADGR
jgi:YbgC/YbaW family acyl-CoA thioester hydrolase